MIESIIQDLHNDLTQIKILLNDKNVKKAEEVLKTAALHLKKFMGYAEFSLFIKDYEKQLGAFVDLFAEASMAVSFASTYSLIDAYNKAILTNDTTQAANLLQQIESEVTFMRGAYLDAGQEGRSQTPAFIDFEKDISYLLRYLEKSKKEALIQLMCNNFTSAMNFKETQQQFFYHQKTLHNTQDTQVLSSSQENTIL